MSGGGVWPLWPPLWLRRCWCGLSPQSHPRQDVGGEAGVLQDGAYYVFAGSGFPGPDEARVPQGIFRYVPGEGKEQLVSYQAHRMDVLFSCWGVNTHSLYYVDIDTNAL